MTNIEFSFEKEIELLRSKLSSDLKRELSVDDVLMIMIKVGSKNYKELFNLGKIMFGDISITSDQVKIAETFIITDLEQSNISETVDETLYGRF